jgi:hypothetical protein
MLKNCMKSSPLASIRGLTFALSAACAMLMGPLTQAQPTINSTYPDGLLLFEPTNSLEVNASSGTGITAFSIALRGTNLDGIGSSNYLTSGHGLTITSGGAGVQVASTPLNTNYYYLAFVTVTDAGGTTTNTISFDTIVPAFIFEAEDFDYGGGKFIDTPQTNAYAGLYATLDVDAYNPNAGNSAYRPINDGTDNGADLGNETTSDVARAGYAAGGFTDYDIGWNNGGSGNWGNYTRHYPAGKWNIYGRIASWATGGKQALMFLGGTKGELLGQFNVPDTQTPASQYQNFTWVPVSDVAGNPIEWDTDGSQQTLTVMTSAGNYNANFYFLMPINTNFAPKPFISNVNPDSSTNVFTPTNVFSFIANSVPGLQNSNIVVTANGITPNGLVFGGSPHAVSGRFPMQSNVVYTINISLTDANGSSSYSEVVGTFQTNNYTWECEDWDYNGGQFFDNPQTDAYAGLDIGVGVDANNTQGGNANYRPNDGLGNEITGDAKRAQYVKLNTNDYDIGWTANGNWANYTRHFPTGVYNIYMRVASPSGQGDALSLYWVTNGFGTTAQGLSSKIGQVNAPHTGGYQNWSWTPVVDLNGNPITVTNSGSVATLRLNEDNGGWNGNFFMFVSPDTQRPVIAGLYPNGHTQFQPTNSLGFTVNSTIPLTSSAVTITVNGVVETNVVFGGTANAMTVSWPYLQPNHSYNVSIVVNNPNNDSTAASYVFDTFSSSYYTWEAEDFDFTNGDFIDNPQLDKYFGLTGTPAIDANNASTTGTSAYRTLDGGDLSTEVTADILRSQYVAAGTNDYDVGYTALGQWANYTRHYPAGAYNVYMRIASPSGQANAVSLSQVTSGVGTATQVTNHLGTFNAPATGGYQAWTFTPLVDAGGNPVTVNMTGGKMTFQAYQNSGGYNMNYFILVPLSGTPTGPLMTAGYGADHQHLVISWSPAGNNLYSSPTLGAGASWTLLGTNNPATVPIAGTAQFFYVGK